MDLPEADDATCAQVLEWLEGFAACVRAVDYAAARPFWHPRVLAFGTYQTVLEGLEDFMTRQWDNVWPRTADFAFVAERVRVLASADAGMAVAIAPWTSTGFHADGTRFDRPGRATLVLARQPGGWRAVHSHMSLERGVPQESHGQRPNAAE
jgi:ketosteroid isomerase-like protein